METHEQLQKCVSQVEQITFLCPQAMIQGQEIDNVAERAIFRLASGQFRLEEIAPGIDLECDFLDHSAFQPIIAEDFKPMPEACSQP